MMPSLRVLVALLFTVLWALVSGSFSLPNLILGLVLGAGTLWLIRDDRPVEGVRMRPLRVLGLAGVFAVELVKSGIKVAQMVLRRDMGLHPGIIAYPLSVKRDFEITILANLITLTPGTLSVDVSDDRGTLYIHCVDATDPAAVVKDMQTSFERRIQEAFR